LGRRKQETLFYFLKKKWRIKRKYILETKKKAVVILKKAKIIFNIIVLKFPL